MTEEEHDASEAMEAWTRAERALAKARLLPVGADRISALREAGKMRFEADRLRHAAEAKLSGASKIRT